MKILNFLDRLSNLDLRQYSIKRHMADLLWVRKTIQYCRYIEKGEISTPIIVFEGTDGKYRVIDGYKRIQALLICKKVYETEVNGEYFDMLAHEVVFRNILEKDISVEVVPNQNFRKIIHNMCINNLTTEELFINDYYESNGYELIKSIAQQKYGVDKWYLDNSTILDIFATYLTGRPMYSHRIIKVKKVEILKSLFNFKSKEFFDFLIKANNYTKLVEEHLSDYKGKRFMVAVANAYHTAEREGKLVKSVDELIDKLLSVSKDEVLDQMKNIKTSIGIKVYNFIKITSYLYLSGTTQRLEWEDVYKNYHLT